MNSVVRNLRHLTPRTMQLIQKRNKTILGPGFKDGFKEIPDHGYAPKHANAYADITTPPPKHAGTAAFNDNVFRCFVIIMATLMMLGMEITPRKKANQYIKDNLPFYQADSRYADYLQKYYHEELSKIMDDEAIIAAASK